MLVRKALPQLKWQRLVLEFFRMLLHELLSQLAAPRLLNNVLSLKRILS